MDFQQAWKKVKGSNNNNNNNNNNKELIESFDELHEIIREIYHCPDGIDAPSDIWNQVQNKFQSQIINKNVSYSIYLQLMLELRDQITDNDGIFFDKSCEFSSSDEYRASLSKHTRMKKGPREKYTKPLTNSQELGWKEPNLDDMPKRLPKQSCAETKFASAMVQAGVYY